MILLFRIISDENQQFRRDLVIEDSDTFLEMHRILQDNLGYDPSQLASFFITSENWEKEQEITLIDMLQDPGSTSPTMSEATLGEYFTRPDQRMIYVFDFFSERAFFMKLIQSSEQTSPRETPFIADAQGDPPPQLVLDHLMDEDREDPTLDEEENGSDDPGLDDLDPDLFENGNPEDY